MTSRPSASEVTTRAELPGVATTRLHGNRLVAARAAWIILVGLILGVLVVALPDFYEASRTIISSQTQVSGQLSPADVREMQEWGISLDVYAAYQAAQIAILSLVFTTVGALLFWRKPTEPGTYTFYCRPHADKAARTGMVGTLIVEP